MKDLNLGLNNVANALTKQDANLPGGYAAVDDGGNIDSTLIPLDYRRGCGYRFNGGNATVPSNDKILFGEQDFSVELFLNPAIVNNLNWVLLKLIPSAYWGIFINSTGNIGVNLVDSKTSQVCTSRTKLVNDKWYHLVFVRRDTTLYLYIDGICDFICSNIDIVNADNNNFLGVGGGNGYPKFRGSISLVRLYNYALKQTDVTYYYNLGNPHMQILRYSDIITNYSSIVEDGTIIDSLNWVLGEDWSIANSKLICNPSSNISFAAAIANIDVGKRYECKFSAVVDSGSAHFELGGYNDLKTLVTSSGYFFACGVLANANSTKNIYFYKDTPDFSGYFSALSIRQVGCVLQLLSDNATSLMWLETQNELHANIINDVKIDYDINPIKLSIVDNLTNDISVGASNKDYILPAGYMVSGLSIKSSVALNAIQLVNVNTLEPLLTNKSIGIASKYYPIISDQSTSDINTTIRLNASGNSGLGFNVIIHLKKNI